MQPPTSSPGGAYRAPGGGSCPAPGSSCWPSAGGDSMPDYLFVGGPLHGRRLAVPEGLTAYRHAAPLAPDPDESWPAEGRVPAFVSWRRPDLHGGERRGSVSLAAAPDADLPAARPARPPPPPPPPP